MPSAIMSRVCGRSIKKSTSAPSLRPTQLRCMSLIGRGQSTSSISSISRSAYAVILQHPLRERHADDRKTAALALAVDHFLIGEHSP